MIGRRGAWRGAQKCRRNCRYIVPAFGIVRWQTRGLEWNNLCIVKIYDTNAMVIEATGFISRIGADSTIATGCSVGFVAESIGSVILRDQMSEGDTNQQHGAKHT